MGQIVYFTGYNALTYGFAYVELPSGSATLTFYGAAANNIVNITDAIIFNKILLIRISGTYVTN